VSSVGGRSGPTYHTLKTQQDSIEAECKRLGIELVDTVVEENKSGADTQRPLFREVMERVLAGPGVVWLPPRQMLVRVDGQPMYASADGGQLTSDGGYRVAEGRGDRLIRLLCM
jgi:hypothetical protein